MPPQQLPPEPQRGVLSLSSFSAASPGFDATSTNLSAGGHRKLKSIQRWCDTPRNQDTTAHLAHVNKDSSPSGGNPIVQLKIKSFMSTYLSAWEMRLTQRTEHSAMQSGHRPPPLPAPASAPLSLFLDMPSLSDRHPFRAASQEASQDSGHERGREARKDKNA